MLACAAFLGIPAPFLIILLGMILPSLALWAALRYDDATNRTDQAAEDAAGLLAAAYHLEIRRPSPTSSKPCLPAHPSRV